MNLYLNDTQIRDLQAQIQNARAQGTLILPEAAPEFMQGIDKDGDTLLHVIFLSEDNATLIPYESTARFSEMIMDYMDENNMPQFPVIHQIGANEWPAMRKGFKYAVSAHP